MSVDMLDFISVCIDKSTGEEVTLNRAAVTYITRLGHTNYTKIYLVDGNSIISTEPYNDIHMKVRYGKR